MPKVRMYFDVNKDLYHKFMECYRTAHKQNKDITKSDFFEVILYSWLVTIDQLSEELKRKLEEEKKEDEH